MRTRQVIIIKGNLSRDNASEELQNLVYKIYCKIIKVKNLNVQTFNERRFKKYNEK